MGPYDGGPATAQQAHLPPNGVGPPPIPRPPPPPGAGLGSPPGGGDHSRHRPPHMGMPPGPPHRQQGSGIYPPLPLPPSPNIGGGGPPGPPYHHPHHPSQQRMYPPFRQDSPHDKINLNSSQGSNPSSSSINPTSLTDSISHHVSRNDPNERTKLIQQRLLLLYHSVKCTAEEGQCKVSNYCADMKRLWKHMARCTDTHCRTPHCFSSRSILSHYRKCTDPRCPTCLPVRESVRRQSTTKPPPTRSELSKYSTS